MQRFRSMKTLQKFSSVHAQVHNHFNQERHLVTLLISSRALSTTDSSSMAILFAENPMVERDGFEPEISLAVLPNTQSKLPFG